MDLEEALILPTMRWLDSQHALIIGYSVAEKKEILLETIDAGITWKKEPIHDKVSTSFISPDGKLLTLMSPDNIVRMFRRIETN